MALAVVRERENETAKREGLDKLGVKEETKHKKKRREKAPKHRHHGQQGTPENGPLRAVTFLPSLSTHSAKAPSGHSALNRLNINDPNAFSFFLFFFLFLQNRRNDFKAVKAGKGVIFRIEFSDLPSDDS